MLMLQQITKSKSSITHRWETHKEFNLIQFIKHINYAVVKMYLKWSHEKKVEF